MELQTKTGLNSSGRNQMHDALDNPWFSGFFVGRNIGKVEK